jgi:hypothetical protein
MYPNELPFEPRHLGVPSGVSKIISKPVVRLTQTMHLSCTQTNTISKMIEMRFYMTHVTLEFHRVHPNRFLRIWYVCCKLWIYLAPILTLSPNGPKRDSTWPTSPILNQDYHTVQTDWNELPFEPRHLVIPSGASKTIFDAMVQLPQTVHLSSTKTNTVSKRTETCFHLSLVTQEYHLVHPKQFLSLW